MEAVGDGGELLRREPVEGPGEQVTGAEHEPGRGPPQDLEATKHKRDEHEQPVRAGQEA